MKRISRIFEIPIVLVLLATVSSCSGKDDSAVASQLPNGEVITIKSATPERDLSLHVIADRDDYGQTDMEFYVSAESPAELHDLVKRNIGKRIRIEWADGLISAAEELEGEKRFAGTASEPREAIGTAPSEEIRSTEESPPQEVALQFPFKAYLRCHVGDINQAFQICLGSGAAGTTLELVNGENSGIFTNIDVMRRRVGTENRLREIEIDLEERFSIKVQNAAERNMLTVRIVDQASGNQVYEGSAGQYEFVAIEN